MNVFVYCSSPNVCKWWKSRYYWIVSKNIKLSIINYSIVSIRNVPAPVPAVKVGSGWLGAEGKNFGVSGKNICISSSRFSLDTNLSLEARISFAGSFSCARGFLSICWKSYIYFVKVDPTEKLRQQRSWTSPGSLRTFEIRSKDFHRHHHNKVNRCLARYSPRAKTTNQMNRKGLAQNEK